MRPQDLLDRLAAGYEYDPMYGSLCNERDQLKAENAKLRELILEIWRELDAAPQYDISVDCCTVYEFAERMRKLRIETERLGDFGEAGD